MRRREANTAFLSRQSQSAFQNVRAEALKPIISLKLGQRATARRAIAESELEKAPSEPESRQGNTTEYWATPIATSNDAKKAGYSAEYEKFGC